MQDRFGEVSGSETIWVEYIKECVAMTCCNFSGDELGNARCKCSARVHDCNIQAAFGAADDRHAVQRRGAEAECMVAVFQFVAFYCVLQT